MRRTVTWVLVAIVAASCGRTGLSVDEPTGGADAGRFDAGRSDAGAPPVSDAGRPRRDAAPIPPPEVPFVSVRAGLDHACAFDEEGRVFCWGDNRTRELGREGPRLSEVPVRVDGVPPVVELDAGHDQTCAVTVDGEVWCWGVIEPPHEVISEPVLVSASREMSDVAVGSGSRCTLSRDTFGAVRCEGVLGSMHSVPGTRVPGRARDIELGSTHGCALVDDEVQCFGHNPDGELGVPPDDRRPWGTERERVVVPGVHDAVAIAPGFAHTCAATATGDLYCWGQNRDGQLALPDRVSGVPPTRVPDLDAVDDVDAGWTVTCALRRGELWCWGDGSRGQLGSGLYFEPQPPTRIDLPEPVRSVTVGLRFVCAIDGDGRPWCWGSNGRGELGDGTRRSSSVPVAVRF